MPVWHRCVSSTYSTILASALTSEEPAIADKFFSRGAAEFTAQINIDRKISKQASGKVLSVAVDKCWANKG